MKTSEIRALIDLIQDDNPRVVAAVCERLVTLGEPALDHLATACNAPDPHLRVRAREIYARLRADHQATRLERALEDPETSLEDAIIQLASLENPDINATSVSTELDRLAALVAGPLRNARGRRERALVLGQVLHDQEGFVGNAREYYDPRNTFIDQVLERRLGIPISLACLYILVGRRLGMHLTGVGMPMHFLTLYREGDEELLIDPFGGGRLMTREACKALLAGYRHRFREEYLRPVSDRRLLRRMMANLVRMYHARDDQLRLTRLYRIIRTLQQYED